MNFLTKVRFPDGRVIIERIESTDGLRAIYDLASRHSVEAPSSGTAIPVVEHAEQRAVV